jgi:hypothetical protein
MGDADAYDEFEPLKRAGEDDEVEPLKRAGEDDEVEPLEIVPYPVEIEAHDPEVGGRSVVRLFFQPGDRAAAPEVDLAEVVILETWDRVSIGLVRRGGQARARTGSGTGRHSLAELT